MQVTRRPLDLNQLDWTRRPDSTRYKIHIESMDTHVMSVLIHLLNIEQKNLGDLVSHVFNNQSITGLSINVRAVALLQLDLDTIGPRYLDMRTSGCAFVVARCLDDVDVALARPRSNSPECVRDRLRWREQSREKGQRRLNGRRTRCFSFGNDAFGTNRCYDSDPLVRLFFITDMSMK